MTLRKATREPRVRAAETKPRSAMSHQRQSGMLKRTATGPAAARVARSAVSARGSSARAHAGDPAKTDDKRSTWASARALTPPHPTFILERLSTPEALLEGFEQFIRMAVMVLVPMILSLTVHEY